MLTENYIELGFEFLQMSKVCASMKFHVLQEGGRDPPRARQSIPPLARGRGKPSHRPKTPVEHRRYVSLIMC